MKEIWRDIKGYEGIYQVSNYGRVKKLVCKGSTKEKIRKTSKDKYGYDQIVLSKNSKSTTYKIHRLVAMTFIENPIITLVLIIRMKIKPITMLKI